MRGIFARRARLPRTAVLASILLALPGCRPAEREQPAQTEPAATSAAAPAATPAPAAKCGLIEGKTCAPVQAASFSSTIPPDICNPQQVGWTPNQQGFDVLSWQTFIALAWPADLAKGRGVADTSKRPGAVDAGGNPLPVVWDTYKPTWEVFRPDDPKWTLTDADWNKWGPPPPGCPSAPAGTPVILMKAKSPPQLARLAERLAQGKVGNEVNEAVGGPLVDQAGHLVRYLIHMNETEFDQIVEGNYYKPGTSTQGLVWYDNATDTQFKIGVIEVKSAWKELSDAEWNGHTYYQRQVLIYDAADPARQQPASCRLQKMGLVGLHIIHKTASAPKWFWATFEHAGNVPPASGGTGPYSFNNPACQPAVTPQQCAAAAKNLPNPDPAVACCPNLQRYQPIGPPPDAPLNMPRGPVQVTRVEPLSGASGCNAAYGQALQGTFWRNYFLVSTQWVDKNNEVQPPVDVVTPATLRNTALETYKVDWNPSHQQVSTSSCIGCHTHGVDFSFVFTADQVAAHAAAAAKAGHP
jgi:hypothetical protein